MKRGWHVLAAATAELPQIECRAMMTGEIENRTSTAVEAWVRAAEVLHVVPALLFVLVQVAPDAGE
jgi:hypothetical protein